MEWNARWVPWTEEGIENLHLLQNDKGIFIDSMMVGSHQGQQFRVSYQIQCNQEWKVQTCAIRLLGAHPQEVKLQSDKQGHWVNVDNIPIPELEGCIDVDISVTPFTNTLPIRRLALRPGQSADLLVVYIALPAVEIRPMRQRYTCLEVSTNGGLYRYESLLSGFSAELHVDTQGLVLDYPELWRRSWDES
ncbi:putative glycolipid-binding domain-containing protein [Dictyobacter kobayashii]|uniref:Uncharacterized protein n=1 Tax=Dictyobacter kobayashii TaxID=2014872 RepID=A0A402ABR5_9CHLR|nr:putative glycolipid-binding domain-containing protein [Dictyobacter kobayashii]GCE16537.1 hypothetical protein KDK_03370 [Dictyobacter kobayashii]